jgi:phosphoglycolate phosphatase
MIGDRAVDIVAAKSHRLGSVAVLWGHGSLEELEAVSPDTLLRYPHELLALAHAD